MTKPPADDTLNRLKAAAGLGGWINDPVEQKPYLVEWRDRYQGKAALILTPKTVPDIQKIVAICSETRTAIVPQGGNTGLVGGQIPSPDGTAVLLSLRHLHRIRSIDAMANTMTADAGVILANVQQAAADACRLFPLSLASEGSATIGGLISTNAGGTGVLAYGTMRELVLGLEVVLADGRLWQGLSGLRKDNTGYDLKHLFIGAEGTLGVITGATLKLVPEEMDARTSMVAIDSPKAAVALLNHVYKRAGRVTAFELIPRIGLDFVLRHIPQTRDPFAAPHPWYVLADTSGHETSSDWVIDAANQGLIRDGVVAQTLSQRDALWKLRDSLSEAQKPEGGSLKHDVSVPISALPDFIEQASHAVVNLIEGARPVPFGHLGDGNVHFNITQPVSANKTDFLSRLDEVARIVHDLVHSFGGSISAEHGIGQAKIDEITRYKSIEALELSRSIKRALDPFNIMNPGKVIRV